MPQRREWRPTLVFLPRESHGQSYLVGYSSRSRRELDTTFPFHFHFPGSLSHLTYPEVTALLSGLPLLWEEPAAQRGLQGLCLPFVFDSQQSLTDSRLDKPTSLGQSEPLPCTFQMYSGGWTMVATVPWREGPETSAAEGLGTASFRPIVNLC